MSPRTSTSDIPVGTHSFRVTQSGSTDDPPILWLHGLGPGESAADCWGSLVTDLGDHFHNVAPDLQASTSPADLLGLLDALGLDEVAVVGHSAGGLLALHLAADAPDRVTSLVLSGTGAAPDDTDVLGFHEVPTAAGDAALAAITQPASVVHGSEDPVTPVAAARYYAERLGDPQLHVFPHAGHQVHLEKQDEFAVLIRTVFRPDDDA